MQQHLLRSSRRELRDELCDVIVGVQRRRVPVAPRDREGVVPLCVIVRSISTCLSHAEVNEATQYLALNGGRVDVVRNRCGVQKLKVRDERSVNHVQSTIEHERRSYLSASELVNALCASASGSIHKVATISQPPRWRNDFSRFYRCVPRPKISGVQYRLLGVASRV